MLQGTSCEGWTQISCESIRPVPVLQHKHITRIMIDQYHKAAAHSKLTSSPIHATNIISYLKALRTSTTVRRAYRDYVNYGEISRL